VLVSVTGVPGSGKSTVGDELQARGYSAVDVDDHTGAWWWFANASHASRMAQVERVLPYRAQLEEVWLADGFELVKSMQAPASVAVDILERCGLPQVRSRVGRLHGGS
jgi:ABC-type nitrate/sulfonate/bicarbonate transport system ATPase subunit